MQSFSELSISPSTKERLTAAYRNHLCFVSENELPKELVAEFREVNRDGRDRMFRILEFVQKSTAYYNNRYFENLVKR